MRAERGVPGGGDPRREARGSTTPGPGQARGARAGTHGTRGGVRPGVAGLWALTWAWVALAGRGLPAGSPVLLLALPLASAFFALRHLAEDERSPRNRLGDGDARQVWSKGSEKSLSPEGRASSRAAWRRRLSPAGSGVDSVTWSVRSVWDDSGLL